MSEPTMKELAEAVAKLQTRLSSVEAELEELRRRSDVEIPEDVLMAISAAVSAYLGNKGRVKAVKFARHRTWAAQGRQAVQTHQPKL